MNQSLIISHSFSTQSPSFNIPLQLNAHVFNSMMGAFAAKGEMGMMEMCYQEMKERKVAPNQYIFITMLTALAKRRDTTRMQQLFEEMIEEYQLIPSAVAFGTMMRGYANRDELEPMFQL